MSLNKHLPKLLRFWLGFFLFGILTNSILTWPKVSPFLQISSLPPATKIKIIFDNLFSLAELYTLESGLITLVNAILFGLVLDLLWRQYRLNKQNKASLGTSTIASVLAAIGAGCGACGTLILGPALAAFGATGLLAILPGHGLEFGILGTLLLLYSFFDLRKKIRSPRVCTV